MSISRRRQSPLPRNRASARSKSARNASPCVGCSTPVFLHISKGEQKTRLEARLADPTKRWKFSPGNLAEREYWDDYIVAYQIALERCSTE